MALKIFRKKVQDLNAIFNGHYIDIKAFYAWQFNRLPSVNFVSEINVTDACKHFSEKYEYCTTEVYQHAWFDHKEDKYFFNNTIFLLSENRMVELAGDYCQILFLPGQADWGMQLTKEMAAFRKVVAEAKDVRIVGFARQAEAN